MYNIVTKYNDRQVNSKNKRGPLSSRPCKAFGKNLKCEVEGCPFVARSQSALEKHSQIHLKFKIVPKPETTPGSHLPGVVPSDQLQNAKEVWKK